MAKAPALPSHYERDALRPGYREPGEPADGRPVIARGKFWRSASEELHYQHAVEDNPIRPGEHPMIYVIRIAEIVAKHPLPPPAKDMPRLPYKEEDED